MLELLYQIILQKCRAEKFLRDRLVQLRNSADNEGEDDGYNDLRDHVKGVVEQGIHTAEHLAVKGVYEPCTDLASRGFIEALKEVGRPCTPKDPTGNKMHNESTEGAD